MRQHVLVLALWLTLGATVLQAQTRSCGTMQKVKQQERSQPNLLQQLRQQARLATQLSPKDVQGMKPLSGVVTIPVVVHVVYNKPEQNISDAQIQSQLAVLNQDFRRLNENRANTPALFQGVAADAEIEFCLARRTPGGEPTNGITRTQTSVTEFGVNDLMKSSATGGTPAWNTAQYLNIWIVKFSDSENVLGYGEFPNSVAPEIDGVVIDFRAFGTMGTAVAPFNKGRTTTHEVGHWLNLFHIWGDEDCGDDQVADTPTQKEENTGCPTFPQASCNNTSDMFMNYMDYTYDACMNLFTQGQKTVMQSSLSRYRAGLLTSPGCQPVQIPALDAAVQGIISPAYVVCENQVAPVVVLKNLGSQPLTWVQIAYRIDNGPSQTVDWSGALATFGTATVALPSLPVTAGAHTLTVSIVSRNGVATDASSANDQYVTAFQVQGLGLPLMQGFESPVFPPEGWRVQNPDYGVTWSRTTRAAKAGAASAYLQNYDYDAAGQVDELVLPPLNLTSRTAPVLTFQLAYSLYSSSDYSDTLEVWVSTDCGVNYQRVYQKFGRSLTTTTPHYTDKEFVPTANQWRLETVDLSAFANTATALVKFRHVTEYENNLYLDDVKVDGVPLGTAEEQALQALQVAPNPTTGLVQITSPEANVERVQVLDAVGKVVQEASYSQGKLVQLSLANQPNGIYLLRLVTPKGVVVRRVLLMR